MKKREYYYFRPPEITGEKLLETFLYFQEDKDIPISQEGINRFYTKLEIDNSESIEILSYLIEELSINDTIEDFVILPELGETAYLNDTLMILPRIYLRMLR